MFAERPVRGIAEKLFWTAMVQRGFACDQWLKFGGCTWRV